MTESKAKEYAFRVEDFWHRRGAADVMVAAIQLPLLPSMAGGHKSSMWVLKSNIGDRNCGIVRIDYRAVKTACHP